MNTNGGEGVKFEFDPTVPAAMTKSDQTITRLVPRDTVQVPTDIPTATPADLLMPAKTVFRYIGPEVSGLVNLSPSIQNYRDDTKWEVTSEPWGYVDYDNNRISVFNTDNDAANWVVVTEDTADYSPRRGNSIGGLDAGQTYVIIQLEDDPTTAVDESHYVQLAINEQNAIDGVSINLFNDPFSPTTTNNRSFGSDDID